MSELGCPYDIINFLRHPKGTTRMGDPHKIDENDLIELPGCLKSGEVFTGAANCFTSAWIVRFITEQYGGVGYCNGDDFTLSLDRPLDIDGIKR